MVELLKVNLKLNCWVELAVNTTRSAFWTFSVTGAFIKRKSIYLGLVHEWFWISQVPVNIHVKSFFVCEVWLRILLISKIFPESVFFFFFSHVTYTAWRFAHYAKGRMVGSSAGQSGMRQSLSSIAEPPQTWKWGLFELTALHNCHQWLQKLLTLLLTTLWGTSMNLLWLVNWLLWPEFHIPLWIIWGI